ncbi:MAG: hypothetical protein ACREFL_03445 [Stellaceae bacterium]
MMAFDGVRAQFHWDRAREVREIAEICRYAEIRQRPRAPRGRRSGAKSDLVEAVPLTLSLSRGAGEGTRVEIAADASPLP